MQFNELASPEHIQKTIESLAANGITAMLVATKEDAKAKIFELLPKGAQVMTMTSTTLDTMGVPEEIMNSDTYNPVKKTLMAMNRETQDLQMQQLGAAPQYALGSVHAVTEEGHLVIASNTGSQLPAYAYGSEHVIWVVGVQKIVPDLDTAMKRIFEYCLPLESERAKKAYGTAGSAVNKILIINKELLPDRLTLIFVNEVIGF